MKIIVIIMALILSKNIYAKDTVSESYNIDGYINSLNEVVQKEEGIDVDLNSIYSDIINGKKEAKQNVIQRVISLVISQIKETLKASIAIVLIVLLEMILSSIELDKNSQSVKIAKLVIIASAATILLKNYIEVQEILKNTIKTILYLLELSTTFLTGVLVATGKITTTGTIAPLIMFVTSAILAITNYVFIPLFNLSIVVHITSEISEEIKLEKLANIFRKSSMYVFTTCISIFVFVLALENTISKSLDNVYFKTTQTVVADSVPVVGKFLADSLETVLGATELVGKVGGTLSIISAILITLVPVIKIAIIAFVYKVISSICQMVNNNKALGNVIDFFASIYKDMLGIIIGTMVIFISVTGIIMHTISKIT